jgi:hypothetical protein
MKSQPEEPESTSALFPPSEQPGPALLHLVATTWPQLKAEAVIGVAILTLDAALPGTFTSPRAPGEPCPGTLNVIRLLRGDCTQAFVFEGFALYDSWLRTVLVPAVHRYNAHVFEVEQLIGESGQEGARRRKADFIASHDGLLAEIALTTLMNCGRLRFIENGPLAPLIARKAARRVLGRDPWQTEVEDVVEAIGDTVRENWRGIAFEGDDGATHFSDDKARDVAAKILGVSRRVVRDELVARNEHGDVETDESGEPRLASPKRSFRRPDVHGLSTSDAREVGDGRDEAAALAEQFEEIDRVRAALERGDDATRAAGAYHAGEFDTRASAGEAFGRSPQQVQRADDKLRHALAAHAPDRAPRRKLRIVR